MNDKQDWADKITGLIQNIGNRPDLAEVQQKQKQMIIKALREARKIDWPSDEEIMAAHDNSSKESWGSIYNPNVWEAAIQWLKSYIEERRK